ncbi:hypothetical protein [Thermus antranikianii]|uniref:hypothetical protein n=1 Tax=Thermus antranikianii TaxID=88190 RepID=UPI001C77DA85|nr:hypothetical protein [Thermus antranikianii]QWK21840.1 MAG: hypothetical protein KNN15_12660 [Thermus antranikianii]
MKKLILGGLLALGFALAQAPYVGGHVGLFGTSGLNLLNGGLHAGVGLQGGLEVRGGVDFTSVSGVLTTGISTDVLMNLSMPGSAALPYAGFGGNLWFSSGTTDFGVHATLGLKYPIAGAPLTAFLEVQPGYAFAGAGAFVYYLKVGANYGF